MVGGILETLRTGALLQEEDLWGTDILGFNQPAFHHFPLLTDTPKTEQAAPQLPCHMGAHASSKVFPYIGYCAILSHA